MLKTYLRVKLSGADTLVSNKKWAWVSRLGHSLLKSVELTIGGT